MGRTGKVIGISLALVIGLLAGLAGIARVQAQGGTLSPGDTVNGLTLKTLDVGPESKRLTGIGDCVRISAEPPPDAGDFTLKRVCSVPLVEDLVLGSGWVAKDAATLETNWSSLSWELYIDGERVNLEAFGFSDYDRVDVVDGAEMTVKVRTWRVGVDALTSGIYEMRSVTRVSKDVFDGFETTLAGTQTFEYTVRVGDVPPVELGGMPKTGGSQEELLWLWLVGAFGIFSLGLVMYARNYKSTRLADLTPPQPEHPRQLSRRG